MAGFAITGTIVGLKEAVEALKGLPGKIQRKVLRPTLTKATKPVLMAVKRLAPEDTGMLKKSIVRKVVTYQKTGAIVVVIGPSEKIRVEVTRRGRTQPMIVNPSKYAHLVEFGTRPHTLAAEDKLARTSEMAEIADLKHVENVHRWTLALSKAKTPEAQEKLQKKIDKSKRFAALRREETQTTGAKRHPGAKPRPFLRPAFDQTRDQVKAIFATEFVKQLEKVAKNVREAK